MKEPGGLSRSDGKRPDGVTMIPWSRGRCLTWDVTAPDTLAPTNITGSARAVGSAAGVAETQKITKYQEIAIKHTFVPLAFETLGAWGEHAINFTAELGRRLSLVSGDVRETFFLRQRLSIAIQRGNAIACLGTLPQKQQSSDI